VTDSQPPSRPRCRNKYALCISASRSKKLICRQIYKPFTEPDYGDLRLRRTHTRTHTHIEWPMTNVDVQYLRPIIPMVQHIMTQRSQLQGLCLALGATVSCLYSCSTCCCLHSLHSSTCLGHSGGSSCSWNSMDPTSSKKTNFYVAILCKCCDKSHRP